MFFKNKKCQRCSGVLKKVGFIKTQGWNCLGCKGTFVKFSHLCFQEQIGIKFDKIKNTMKDSDLNCLSCDTKMKKYSLGGIGLEIEFCPRDYSIWFDMNEPEEFIKWFEKNAKQNLGINWKNPQEPSDISIIASVYFGVDF